MMKLKCYSENQGMKNITIFILIDLKREIKEIIVVVMKMKKTYIEATHQTKTFFIIIQNCNLFQKQNQTRFSNLLNVIFN